MVVDACPVTVSTNEPEVFTVTSASQAEAPLSYAMPSFLTLPTIDDDDTPGHFINPSYFHIALSPPFVLPATSVIVNPNMVLDLMVTDLTVSADSLTVSNGVSSSDYDAIDAYTYWDRVNENRRFIKLVNRSYLPAVIEQFNNLV